MFVKMYFVLLFGLFLYVQGQDVNITTVNITTVNITSTLKPIDFVLQCLRETGANPNHVKRLTAGNYYRSNAALKKWVLCYLVKIGVMSSSGVLRQHIVLQDIPDKDKNIVEKTIDKCLYKSPHEPAETAWHYLTCFKSKQPKYTKNANRI